MFKFWCILHSGNSENLKGSKKWRIYRDSKKKEISNHIRRKGNLDKVSKNRFNHRSFLWFEMATTGIEQLSLNTLSNNNNNNNSNSKSSSRRNSLQAKKTPRSSRPGMVLSNFFTVLNKIKSFFNPVIIILWRSLDRVCFVSQKKVKIPGWDNSSLAAKGLHHRYSAIWLCGISSHWRVEKELPDALEAVVKCSYKQYGWMEKR